MLKIAANSKAWGSAISVLGMVLLARFTGLVEMPSETVVTDALMTGGTALVSAGVSYATTYFFPKNS